MIERKIFKNFLFLLLLWEIMDKTKMVFKFSRQWNFMKTNSYAPKLIGRRAYFVTIFSYFPSSKSISASCILIPFHFKVILIGYL